MLALTAVNASNGKKQLVSFVVFDKTGKKVAEARRVKEASFRLPVGKYKVISTLNNTDSNTRNTRPVKSSKTVRISANRKTSKVFKQSPPPTLGVLQVSAEDANSGKTIKANYIVQKENGKTIATRTNVSHTLFKLKAGIYRVTVRNANHSDFRTVVVEPGESTTEVFKLQSVLQQGKLFVQVADSRSNKPLKADITITTPNGTTVQQLKSVSRTEISLLPGNYKIRVTGSNGQSSKKIHISAGQAVKQIFHFDAPAPVVLPEPSLNEVQINENVKITPAKEVKEPKVVKEQSGRNQQNQQKPAPQVIIKGSIKLYAKDDANNAPLKSNFYVQLPNGKNIAKKVYSNSAQFSVEPGVYKITVRSKNRKNITRSIRVSPGQSVTEVFSLKSTLPKPEKVARTNTPPVTPPVLAPAKPTKPTKPAPVETPEKTAAEYIPNGFLSVAMRPPGKTHFIVATRSGKKIVELTSVPSANFKLDTGNYVVTAIKNKKRRSKNVRVRKGKTSYVNFNARNFQPPRNNRRNTAIAMGVLRSRIVNRNGQPLRGDLTVTNSRGQVVARANSVSVGVFDLPPEPHTIILNYKGLRGSERILIRPGETTMQTFTIAPSRSRPGNTGNRMPDRAEEGIGRRF